MVKRHALKHRFARTFRCIICGLVFLIHGALARAERLPLKFYTTADGLPHNDINRIVRDSRGFLWICTADGLARFDGYSFKIFGAEHGLPPGSVRDLLETKDGQYWVAASTGLLKFNSGNKPPQDLVYVMERSKPAGAIFAKVMSEDEDSRAASITVLFEDKSGTVWCGTEKGLCRVERTSGRPIVHFVDIGIPQEYPEQAYVSDILEDRAGTLWIATHDGLYARSRDGQSRRYVTRNGLPHDFLHRLLQDHLGQLWAAGRYGGFFQLHAQILRAHSWSSAAIPRTICRS